MRRGRVAAGRVEQLADAEIEQHRRAVVAHENVARLDVAMHDQMLMRVLHRAAQLGEEAQASAQIERVLRAEHVHRHAFDVLHREVRHALGGFAGIEQARDIRMIELGEKSALARETIAGERARKIADQFQRDALARAAELALGEIHRAHATGADLAQETIRSDAMARRARAVADGRIQRHAQARVALRVMRDETLDRGAKLGIGFFGREERGALAGGPLERGVEQRFHACDARRAHVRRRPCGCARTKRRSASPANTPPALSPPMTYCPALPRPGNAARSA